MTDDKDLHVYGQHVNRTSIPLSLIMFPFVSKVVCGVCTSTLYEVDFGKYIAMDFCTPR